MVRSAEGRPTGHAVHVQSQGTMQGRAGAGEPWGPSRVHPPALQPPSPCSPIPPPTAPCPGIPPDLQQVARLEVRQARLRGGAEGVEPAGAGRDAQRVKHDERGAQLAAAERRKAALKGAQEVVPPGSRGWEQRGHGTQ